MIEVSAAESAPLQAIPLDAALALLLAKRGVDLSGYRLATLRRWLAYRMARVGARSAAVYLERLSTDPREADQLLDCLLVPVTSFFRDPAVFSALEREVLPPLIRAGASRGVLRAWVPGTSTGEEAWSLAMLLRQECERIPGADFRLLGTDLHPRRLELAARGAYAGRPGDQIPAPLRERYLTPQGDLLTVTETLRQRVRFAWHDLVGSRLTARAAVIASFELVMLRNVLIYFTPRLQERALERLATVVQPGGVLVLGPAEHLCGTASQAFEPYPALDPRLRIFRRRLRGSP